jgi:hypothetical protein
MTTVTYLTSGFYSEVMAEEYYPWKRYGQAVRLVEGGSCEVESKSLVRRIRKTIISLFKRG